MTASLAELRAVVPHLSSGHHKGSCGRVGVLGGSREYVGGPYFSAFASLRVGADISHVFCHEEASAPIKSFSPDLIVHPVIFTADTDPGVAAERVFSWFPALHSLVVGPGLGRDPFAGEVARRVMERARSSGLALVVDADGLHALLQDPTLFTRTPPSSPVVLTPNAPEYERLCKAVGGAEDELVLAGKLGACVLRKGAVDTLAIPGAKVSINASGGEAGCPRRCGGQGDLLSGAIATWLCWTKDPSLAVPGAAMTIRRAAQMAFEHQKRAMIAQDILPHIGPAFHHLFEKK